MRTANNAADMGRRLMENYICPAVAVVTEIVAPICHPDVSCVAVGWEICFQKSSKLL